MYALWPLCHFARDRKFNEIIRVVFPLYFQHVEGDDFWWLVPPLIYQQQCEDRRTTITPLWCSGKNKDTRWHAALPFYYYGANPTRQTSQCLTPIVGRTRSQDGSRWFVFPLLTSVAWGDEKKDVWLLAPLMRFRWGHNNLQNHVFPIYAYDRNRKMVLTPLVSWKRGEHEAFLNLLGLLAHYSRGSNKRKAFYLLPPLAGVRWQEGAGPEHARLLPLFSWSKSGRRRSLWIVPWMFFESSPTRAKNSFLPLWSYSRKTIATGTQRRQQTDFRLLLWLYDYRAQTRPWTPTQAGGDKEYVRRGANGLLVHTNTAESFFALLKRGHYGVFHQLSKHHLHRYCHEFTFRWDHRHVSDGERMVAAIRGAEGKRLMYK